MPDIIEIIDQTQTVEIVSSPLTLEVLSPGPQGPQGPQGLPGGSNFSLTAGVNIGAYVSVVLIGGQIYPADIFDASHVGFLVGITTSSALSGNPVNVQYTGKVTGGAFTAGSRYYVGALGIPSTTPPAGAAWESILGIAESGTILVLTPFRQIVL